MKVPRRIATVWISAHVVVLVFAACTPPAPTTSQDATAPSTPDAVTTAPPLLAQPALFYSKAGSLYVSDPAGTPPGRKLTDGPADTDPAPSPRPRACGLHPEGGCVRLRRRVVGARPLA